MVWTCDGVAKDGKSYPDKGGQHAPHDNYGPDCDICGLPQAAMQASVSRSSNSPLPLVLAALITLGLIGAIGAFLLSLTKDCPPGQQKQFLNCVATVNPSPTPTATPTKLDPNSNSNAIPNPNITSMLYSNPTQTSTPTYLKLTLTISTTYTSTLNLYYFIALS